jgi:cysteine-rich repeat protein
MTKQSIIASIFALVTATAASTGCTTNGTGADDFVESSQQALQGGTCVTRPKVMFCGTSSRRGTPALYAKSDGTAMALVEADGCAPDANTQALFVTRSGTINAANGALWKAYLAAGGRIITEYNVGASVYNAIYGTNYAKGGNFGSCSDVLMPVVKLTPAHPFWVTNNIPVTAAGNAGCGFDLANIVAGEAGKVLPLGAPAAGAQVSLAARDEALGVLFLAESDWQDNQASYTLDSSKLMGAMVGACGGSCGDGILQAGEGCDDNNKVAGDGCSATCKIETPKACNANVAGAVGSASCESGVCDTQGQAAPGICEAALTCGNGKLEAGEGCDDGNTVANDGCNATCKIETPKACNADAAGAVDDASCASGICNDVGNPAPGLCAAANACGNGKLEAGEICDDGNTAAGDGCSATCKIEDGKPCGAAGDASCASGVCDVKGQAAPGVCEGALKCGNGKVEAGESCDDGNVTVGDGCDAACKVELGGACTANESCQSGACNLTGGNPGVCVAAGVCGNGVREAGEACDDGNTKAADGCNATCKVETGKSCNDKTPGVVGDSGCESGVCNAVAGAPGTCAAANACGNGKVDSGEACDDGNTKAGDGCDASCKVENGKPCGAAGDATCASGVCNTTGGKPGTCAAVGCGNGKVESGETCDDGNTKAGDGCDASCKKEVAAGCGNGKVETGEYCDDGNTKVGDGCDSACKIEKGGKCTASAACDTGFCDTTAGVCAAPSTTGDATEGGGCSCDTSGGLPVDGGVLTAVSAMLMGLIARKRRA